MISTFGNTTLGGRVLNGHFFTISPFFHKQVKMIIKSIQKLTPFSSLVLKLISCLFSNLRFSFLLTLYCHILSLEKDPPRSHVTSPSSPPLGIEFLNSSSIDRCKSCLKFLYLLWVLIHPTIQIKGRQDLYYNDHSNLCVWY